MRDKRIAVLTHAFSASTFPVVKRLVQMGNEVDFYEICLDTITSFESFESDRIPTKHGVHRVDIAWYHELDNYLGDAKIKLYYSRTQRPYLRIPFVKQWAAWRIRRQIKHLCRVIDSRDYDCVMGVGAYNNMYYEYAYRYLKTPMVMILHEVVDHFCPNYDMQSPLVKNILDNKRDLIVLSEHTKEQFLKYKHAISHNVYVAKLGLSEINRYIPNNHVHDDLKDYIFYFGSMLPYKGINVLYDALVHHPDCLCGKKLVMSGRGSEDIVEKFKTLSNVILFNHYAPISEIVELIQNSRALVMPYLSASQSGIPQVAYIFSKPIVATRIPSLMDFVKDEENGLLCNVNDADDLARQLKRITSDDKLYNILCSNVMKFEQDYPEFSWDVSTHIIADVLEKNMKKR